MKRFASVSVALVFLTLPVAAGEYLMNEEVAYGLRVTFSEPVTVTHFGDVLMTMMPQGEASEFMFYGAELPAWVGHGLMWAPASARIVDYEWLSSPPVEEDLPYEQRKMVVSSNLLIDDFADGDLMSEFGTLWSFYEWGGSFAGTRRVARDHAEDPYLSFEIEKPIVGIRVELPSLDLTSYHSLSVDLSVSSDIWFNVGLMREDEDCPCGEVGYGWGSPIQAGRQDYILPLNAFAASQADIA